MGQSKCPNCDGTLKYRADHRKFGCDSCGSFFTEEQVKKLFKGNDGVMLHVPGNLMGTFGSNVGEDCSDWYVPTGSASEYATAEWQCSWVHTRVEGKWLLKGFVDGTTDSTLVFMRWSIPNQADVYIDNLTFYDEDGKSIPIIYGTGEAAAETESEDVTSAEDEAPVTEAAPEAEENTETTEETGGENGAE